MSSPTHGLESMRIVGEWQTGDDGMTRPVVRAKCGPLDGTLQADVFLIDSGADRTVFSADLLEKLGFPGDAGDRRLDPSGRSAGWASPSW